MTSTALAQWREIAHSGNVAALDALLADDVTFFSPVVFRPQQGKAITKTYLWAAVAVLGNETFRFTEEWTGANSGVLEFTATVDGVEINGADFIAWDETNRVVSFKVMARPLKGIDKLREKMAAQLERASVAGE
jgi:hypothetical protein